MRMFAVEQYTHGIGWVEVFRVSRLTKNVLERLVEDYRNCKVSRFRPL